MTGRRPLPTSLPPVDHLVWGGRRLDEEIARLEAWTGVRAAPGGRHPGEGTHNALIGLGPGRYLELIAPDPEATAPARPRWFGLDTLAAPGLVAWAAKATDLERRAGRPEPPVSRSAMCATGGGSGRTAASSPGGSPIRVSVRMLRSFPS